MTSTILPAIAPGELIDKITILRIKSERISDSAKLENVRRELDVLSRTRDEAVPESAEMTRLEQALKTVNEALWESDDDIRYC